MAVGMIFTFRRKTAAAWTAANPVLLAGELGLETDTRFFKFGDGATAWATLPYAAAVSSVWGSITGTLGNQTDLAAVLAGKQPLDSDLTTIAGLAVVNDNFMQAKAGAWAGRTVAQVKTDLGVPGTASGTNTGDQTITLTGDVTGSGAGTFAASISAGAVTSGKIAAGAVVNAALANMPATTIKGNATAGPAAPTDLTGTQTTAMLDLFGVTLKGLVPASGGGTANFMRADGAWAAPPMTTSLPWGSITGTPTTIAGYGITDAVTLAGSQTVTGSKTFSVSTAFSSGAVVTGSITGTAITQTATDTTAGRLLKVGDFGLGATAGTYIFGRANLLGTVSQSAGVPTGAGIERGANANGEYVKFADGTLLCTVAGVSMTYNSADLIVYTWTFPAAFVVGSLPVVTASFSSGADYIGLARRDVGAFGHGAGTAGVVCVVSRVSGATRSFAPGDIIANTRLKAKGRWF